ncbi:hypothetical protein KKC22_01320 [Myxococcota bacterium]|nr:hypothetical protein [Myxococcota bacterium]
MNEQIKNPNQIKHEKAHAEYQFKAFMMNHPDILIDMRPFGGLASYQEARAAVGEAELAEAVLDNGAPCVRQIRCAGFLKKHDLDHYFRGPAGDFVQVAVVPCLDDITEKTLPAEVDRLVHGERHQVYPTNGNELHGDPLNDANAYGLFRLFEDQPFQLRPRSERLPMRDACPPWAKADAAGAFCAPSDMGHGFLTIWRTPEVLDRIRKNKLAAVVSKDTVYILTAFENLHTGTEHQIWWTSASDAPQLLQSSFLEQSGRSRREVNPRVPLPGQGAYFTRGKNFLSTSRIGDILEVKE